MSEQDVGEHLLFIQVLNRADVAGIRMLIDIIVMVTLIIIRSQASTIQT